MELLIDWWLSDSKDLRSKTVGKIVVLQELPGAIEKSLNTMESKTGTPLKILEFVYILVSQFRTFFHLDEKTRQSLF